MRPGFSVVLKPNLYLTRHSALANISVTVLQTFAGSQQIDNTLSLPTLTWHSAEIWFIMWKLKPQLPPVDIYLKQVFITRGNSEGKMNILGCNSVGYCEKVFLINMCLIPHCFDDSALSVHK